MKQVEENRGRGLTKCYFTQNVTHELLIQILNTKLSITGKNVSDIFGRGKYKCFCTLACDCDHP